MSSQSELVKVEGNALDAQAGRYTSKDLAVIRDVFAKGTTESEFAVFLQVVGRAGLDPFARQVHAVKRWDDKAGREVMAIQVGIDGFRVIAQRSGRYRGRVGPQWCGRDGVWVDVWLDPLPPAAARVGILVEGFAEPVWGVARYQSFAQIKRDGKPMAMWAKMPEHMLAKCAESQALRAAFPQDLSDLYTDEEMGQADRVSPVMDVARPPSRPRASDIFKPKPVANVAAEVPAEVASPESLSPGAAAPSAPTPAPEAPSDAPPAADAGGGGGQDAQPFDELAFWERLEAAAAAGGVIPSDLPKVVQGHLDRKGWKTLEEAPPKWREKLVQVIATPAKPAPAA